MPSELNPLIAPSGCLLLSAAYVTIGVSLLAGSNNEALLVVLVGLGGLGLGTQFNSIVAHLTNNAPPRYAPDISDVSTTFMQIGGAMAVAAFGPTPFLSPSRRWVSRPSRSVLPLAVSDDLAWWGEALKRARVEGELPPGTFRARSAAAGRQTR